MEKTEFLKQVETIANRLNQIAKECGGGCSYILIANDKAIPTYKEVHGTGDRYDCARLISTFTRDHDVALDVLRSFNGQSIEEFSRKLINQYQLFQKLETKDVSMEDMTNNTELQ